MVPDSSWKGPMNGPWVPRRKHGILEEQDTSYQVTLSFVPTWEPLLLANDSADSGQGDMQSRSCTSQGFGENISLYVGELKSSQLGLNSTADSQALVYTCLKDSCFNLEFGCPLKMGWWFNQVCPTPLCRNET